MAKTELLIQTVGGAEGPHLSIEPKKLVYKFRRNRPGAIEFTVKDTHPEVNSSTIRVREHEALVRRDNADRWVGPILTLDESERGELTFRGEGLSWYMKGWHITTNLTYLSTDQFAIARGYIQHHLNKSGGAKFNLSVDATEISGKLRTRRVFSWEQSNIYDLMIDFTEIQDGFDWEVRPSDRTVHMFYPRKGARRENARFGSAQIKRFSRQIAGDEVASEVLGTGAGSREDTLTATIGDSAAKATYGLSQRKYVNKDVKDSGTLAGHVASQLQDARRVPHILKVTARTNEPELFKEYDVDDEVFIDYESRYERVQEYQHLVGYDVIVERGAEERVVLYTNPILGG